MYSTYLGGSSLDVGLGIAVDASGRAYITGYTRSDNFPTENAYQGAHGGGGWDAFVTGFTADGSGLMYSTYLGGSGYDAGWGIAVDASGRAYVTGDTNSDLNFPLKDAYQGAHGGGYDAFVTGFAADGSSLMYSTYLGGSGTDDGHGIAVDASGCAYITGYTYSDNTTFPLKNAYQGAYGGKRDAFVTKIGAPDITATPASIDFGPVVVTSSSAPQTVTVSNTGTGSLTIGTIDIIGADASQFSKQNDNVSGQTISPGGSATLEVVFSPTSIGTKTAALSIPSNDPDEATVNVALSGTGIQQTQSVATATGTGAATFTTDSGGITGLTAIAQAGLACPPRSGLTFPHGFFSFNITNITPGSTVTITITLPSAMAVGTQYSKCQSGQRVNVTSLLGDDDGDNVLTLALTDGGLGDADGSADGTIVDPGGPAVAVAAAAAAAPAAPGASYGADKTPPYLKTKYLNVNPQQVYAGQTVTISTNVVNHGGEAGSYTVALKINGQVEQTRTVTVSPGVARPVRFTVSKTRPGTYTVAVGGDRGQFTVIAASNGWSIAMGNGPVVAVATLVFVLLLGLLVVAARRRFQPH